MMSLRGALLQALRAFYTLRISELHLIVHSVITLLDQYSQLFHCFDDFRLALIRPRQFTHSVFCSAAPVFIAAPIGRPESIFNISPQDCVQYVDA